MNYQEIIKDILNKCVNSQDAVILALINEKICFTLEELSNLTIEDCDFHSSIIKNKTVPSAIMNLAKEAYEQKEYYKYYIIEDEIGRIAKLHDSNYIIKYVKKEPENKANIIYNRLKRILKHLLGAKFCEEYLIYLKNEGFSVR